MNNDNLYMYMLYVISPQDIPSLPPSVTRPCAIRYEGWQSQEDQDTVHGAGAYHRTQGWHVTLTVLINGIYNIAINCWIFLISMFSLKSL